MNSLRSKDLIHWESPTAGRGAATAATTTADGGASAHHTGSRGRAVAEEAAREMIRATVSGCQGCPIRISAVLPNVRELWAPDISFSKGKYMMYFAASTFGSNTSAIGLATNKTLDPASPDYRWTDAGVVIASKASDFYNCIDPNAFYDTDGTAWLTFGSFYWNQGGGRNGPANPDAAIKGGIQLVKLNPETGLLMAGAKPQGIASRAYPERAIEAPFLIHEGKYYYLFVSWDRCCQGLRSTYRIMVGRSEKVTGPYVDKDGMDMVKGGGTQVLAGDGKRIIGPGHEGLFKDGDRWLMVHHFYDGNTTNGTSRLQVRPVTIDEKGWPVAGKAINSPD